MIVAVVRHAGRIVAFANIWTTPDKNEFTVDLMRHRPDAPHGMMDLLFMREKPFSAPPRVASHSSDTSRNSAIIGSSLLRGIISTPAPDLSRMSGVACGPRRPQG